MRPKLSTHDTFFIHFSVSLLQILDNKEPENNVLFVNFVVFCFTHTLLFFLFFF